MTRRAKKRKPRTYKGGCYQHHYTQTWCEACRTYAEIDGMPLPPREPIVPRKRFKIVKDEKP